MKTKLTFLTCIFACLLACRKEQNEVSRHPVAGSTKDSLTLKQVAGWLDSQRTATGHYTESEGRSFHISALGISLENAHSFANKTGNYWLVKLDGVPKFGNVKQGYRKIAFLKDTTGNIRARIIEFIPDGLYYQRKGKVTTADYTGRIFIYDANYRLLGGEIRAEGKLIGAIRPAAKLKVASAVHPDYVRVTTDCTWMDNNYVDADGNAVIYSEKICTYTVDDDTPNTGFSGGTGNYGGDEGGGSGSGAPAPSNLPGENGPAVNPKSLMDCFGNIPDAGASMKVTVYVQEPFPGTSFNIGPNSVGHVAIGLTKTNGANSVTQVLGYYPDATGLNKLLAPSKIVENSNLDYNVSITYNVTATSFNLIKNYISNPPALYDLVDFNCTTFVYYACQAGKITLPDPYNSIGISLPTGETRAMSPAGLGQSIEKLKGQSNVNPNGGFCPYGKGPCD